MSSSDHDYLLFSIRGDSGWIKNTFGRTVNISASGGSAASNRCDVHGSILEIGYVVGSVDANDSWSKGCSISFSVPKGFSFKVTSYPYNYGAGSATIYMH